MTKQNYGTSKAFIIDFHVLLSLVNLDQTAHCSVIKDLLLKLQTVKCSAGFECQLVEVTCVRAPCFPQPQCVETKSEHF